MSSSWIQMLQSFDPLDSLAHLVFGNGNPQEEGNAYKTYKSLCEEKNLHPQRTNFELERLILAASKIQTGCFYIIGQFNTDHQLLLCKSRSRKILIGIKEGPPLKESSNYVIHACLLKDPEQVDLPSKANLKLVYRKHHQMLLKEIDFLKKLSAASILGIDAPLVRDIYWQGHLIGYSLSHSYRQNYTEYMECVDKIPFQTFLSHLQQLLYAFIFLKHHQILHGSLSESTILINNNRVSLAYFEELKILNWEPTHQEAIKMALKAEQFQLGSIFNRIFNHFGFDSIDLSETLSSMVDPLEELRPSLEEVLEKIERFVSPFFSLLLSKSYQALSLKSQTHPIPSQNMFHLCDAALQLEPKTFAILKSQEKTSTQFFMIAKTEENHIRIGWIHKILGKGNYGKVFSSVFLGRDSMEEIAIKQALDSRSTRSIKSEIAILNALHLEHENIPGVQPAPLFVLTQKNLQIDPSFSLCNEYSYATESFTSNYLLFMEQITKSLPNPITKKNISNLLERSPASFSTLLSHLLQLSQGLEFLQRKKIIHSDIKAQNVLIKNGEVKISDFGSAKNTTLGDNPDPENFPYKITPLKSILEIHSKNMKNPQERCEAIEIALSIDRYQLGDLFFRILNWVASGYSVIHFTENQLPYRFEKIKFEKDDLRKYPQHFTPYFNAKEKVEIPPQNFLSKVSLPDPLSKFVKEMVTVDETIRPSMETILKTFERLQNN